MANYSPPVLPPDPALPDEWQTLLRLAALAAGRPVPDDVEPLDRLVAGELLRRETGNAHSPVFGRDGDELLAELAPRRGPERLLDILLRCGPYGDGFGARPGGLTLAALEAAPHGIDLGPLEPRLPDMLRAPSGRIELAPPAIVCDVARLREALTRPFDADALVLVGRRQLRSNNSWMHNLARLVSGPARSLPHGWGHDAPGARLGVAGAHPGVNANLLADEALVDALSGNAVLNGIPVAVAPVPA